ncbi:unnamed protein product [Brassicogethes aeneus]|uniref:Acyl-CoA synthetase family member 3, mitochondrial n=1 Tax=Brassicogethes aeneus TaxID=1431903 RepID=A0A9P0FCM6_BRAAE|nr:unnamed protein product [Brassicogethes aeneus]
MSLITRSLRNSLKLRNNVQRRFQQTKPNLQVNPAPTAISGPVFTNAGNYAERIAIRDKIASYTYANIFFSANELSKEITKLVNGKTNERIMFLCPNDANYVITLWAIWMSGQIAVPLSPLHPKNILLYYASDTNSSLLITTGEYAELMQKVARNSQTKLHVLDDKLRLNCAQNLANSESDMTTNLPSSFYDSRNAMILYTSGTTGSPKGVVLSHKNLNFQVSTLLDAWKWSQNDVLLHTLPLHHVHGIVNALLCPLYIGAKTLMLERFNANLVWSHLLGVTQGNKEERRISVYMAVPTIYSKLIDEYERVFKKDNKMAEYIKHTLKNKIRLMVSGSAPLPAPVYQKWAEISGHSLLERYGMTEIGMCLSNLYDSDREPGYVGVPLPGVSIKIASDEGDLVECTNNNGEVKVKKIKGTEENPQGELFVKSDGVFTEYFKRPDATKAEFTQDGWFKTGDICQYNSKKNKFKILGRKSVDIIKSGGYKLSALQIETELLTNPKVKDIAVVGISDETWGERVAALVVPRKGEEVTVENFTEWALNKLPKYSVPTVVKIVEEIPKNAMGKINKKDLVKTFF